MRQIAARAAARQTIAAAGYPYATMRPPLTARLAPFGTTIFTEMTELAVRHGAVNLGQGFPDFDGPEFVKEAALRAIRDGRNQYVRMFGLPELNRAVAGHRRRFYGLDYDPEREVTVFSGATEALFATFQALFDAGDEAILFEPFYDSYRPGLANAGARAVVVPLRPPDFRLDPDALDACGDAAHARDRPQLAAQPGREGLRAGGAGGGRRGLPAPRPAGDHRRGLRAPRLRGGAPAAGDAARDARADRDDLVGGEDLQPDRLEDRLRLCAGAADARAARRAPVRHLLHPGAVPARGGRRAGGGRRLLRALRRRLPRAARPAVRRARSGRVRRAGAAGDLLRRRRHPPAGLRRRPGLLPRAPGGTKGVAAIPVSAFCEEPARARHLVRFAFCKQDATLDEAIARLARPPSGPAGGGPARRPAPTA